MLPSRAGRWPRFIKKPVYLALESLIGQDGEIVLPAPKIRPVEEECPERESRAVLPPQV